ncbi:integral membrane protein [Fusarium mundagurra]|uniref:Integral membrane protein n=1 Tax=Fusarium mundagurra TaxID=1567541 RepID=A0A8H5Y077_9HYPO|nr:integral membrane protein [Fusarium mundagurra]
MWEALPLWEPQPRVSEDSIKIDDLSISFMRSIRVPDNERPAPRPPWLDKFPLVKTDYYAHKLPLSMAEKGGIFIPIYLNEERESMRINFKSRNRYAIKIFVGNVNAISGEPQILDAETVRRRRELLAQGKSIQDFVVTPYQPWLDTMATEPGNFRPFVAMPSRSGQSAVKAQMTEQEATTCLRFEITRLEIPREEERFIEITLLALDRIIEARVSTYLPLSYIHRMIFESHGIPIHEQGTVCDRERLEDHRRLLVDYGIDEGSTIEVFDLKRHCGAGPPPPPRPQPVNTQRIVEIPGRYCLKSTTIAFNAQILNIATFSAITGVGPPYTPVSARAYEELGLPFYHLYEEPSRSGGLSGLKSVTKKVFGAPKRALRKLKKVGNVGLLDPRGPKSELLLPWEFLAGAQDG